MKYKLTNRIKKILFSVGCILVFLSVAHMNTWAAQWSTTEYHFQYGELETPFSGGDQMTQVHTLQHSSGWKYGDNFFFIDLLIPEDSNDINFYGELYSNFSLGKITGKEIGYGPVSDVGLLAGFNLDADSDVRVYLPGVSLSWDVPGFTFLNTYFTAYIVDNPGTGAPDTDNSFMVDVNWKYPFKIGSGKFSIQGHVEYIGEREDEFGGEVEGWILAQPQFRWDIGAMFNSANKLFLGVEYQYWMNKKGVEGTNEYAPQALAVWQF